MASEKDRAKERQDEIERYVSDKCKNCKMNSKNKELYKLNLPNEVINIIRKMTYEPCKHCRQFNSVKSINRMLYECDTDRPNFTISRVEFSYFLHFYALPSYEKLKEHVIVGYTKYRLYKNLFEIGLSTLHERKIKENILNSNFDLKKDN